MRVKTKDPFMTSYLSTPLHLIKNSKGSSTVSGGM